MHGVAKSRTRWGTGLNWTECQWREPWKTRQTSRTERTRWKQPAPQRRRQSSSADLPHCCWLGGRRTGARALCEPPVRRQRGLCPETPRSWVRLAIWTWKGFFPTASGKERSPTHSLDLAWWDPCWILTYRNYEIRNLCCLKPLNLWSFFYGRKCVESINHSVVSISLRFNGL